MVLQEKVGLSSHVSQEEKKRTQIKHKKDISQNAKPALRADPFNFSIFITFVHQNCFLICNTGSRSLHGGLPKGLKTRTVSEYSGQCLADSRRLTATSERTAG